MENVTGKSLQAFEEKICEDRELRLKLMAHGKILLEVSSGKDLVVDAVELMHALAKECLCSHREER